jgi:N-acyl-D-aspartate/D-glutamate deacylase
MNLKKLGLLSLFCVSLWGAQAPPYDIVITGGTVFDGTGSAGFKADIGIQGGAIAAVGQIGAASGKRVISAQGLYVVPGFIDIHTHGDSGIIRDESKSAQNYVMQGVTTLVTGNCGGGTYNVADYFAEMQQRGAGVNIIHLVGHGTVRGAVMKDADRAPTAAELEQMRGLVKKAMQEGAWGISSGLFYAPGSFAKVDEIVELAKVVRPYGGLYASHIRDESNYTTGLKASIAEAIEVGERAGVPVEISHIKALGKPVWGQAAEICKVIEAARARGVKVRADQYPYNASGTSMSAATLPRWVEGDGQTRARLTDPGLLPGIRKEVGDNIDRRGGADTLVVSSFRAKPEWEGKSLEEISRIMGKNPVDAAIEIVLMGGAGVTSFNMSDSDIEYFMKQPWVMTGSDGDVVQFGRGLPHPRSYGTFARKIRQYVIEKKVLGMARAIRAATGLPAEALGVKDRGLIKKGLAADIVVFDPARIEDKATYTQPHQYAEGIRYLFVNGRLEVEEGKYTGVLAGKPLSLNPAASSK